MFFIIYCLLSKYNNYILGKIVMLKKPLLSSLVIFIGFGIYTGSNSTQDKEKSSNNNYISGYGYVPNSEEHHLNPTAPLEKPDSDGNYNDGSFVVVNQNIGMGAGDKETQNALYKTLNDKK